jgi:hypothetical protein
MRIKTKVCAPTSQPLYVYAIHVDFCVGTPETFDILSQVSEEIGLDIASQVCCIALPLSTDCRQHYLIKHILARYTQLKPAPVRAPPQATAQTDDAEPGDAELSRLIAQLSA